MLLAGVRKLNASSSPERNNGGGHLEITDPPVVEQKSGNAPATIAADTVLEVKVPIRVS